MTFSITARCELQEREPDVSYRKLELVDAHNWIGKTARKSNQLNSAVRHHSMACSILRQLHEDEPEETEYVIRLSRAETRLGQTLSEVRPYRRRGSRR